jgi:gluconate 2-dehydrogenase gamma chain
MIQPNRRQLLGSMAVAAAAAPLGVRAAVIKGSLPWTPDRTQPPDVVSRGGWLYFSPQEAETVEALVDRLIPPDPDTPGGKDAGCAVFIDRQLAGSYGHSEGLYTTGPFHDGTKEQGPQSAMTPAQHYRQALAALETHCQGTFSSAHFTALSDDQKDGVIRDLEHGNIDLGEAPGSFFKQLLKDTQQGFFADPVYGGNKDMCAWKMIGFPGARYDYRDWVERHNERFPLPPIGVADHPRWRG